MVAQWFEMRDGRNEGVNDELVEEEGNCFYFVFIPFFDVFIPFLFRFLTFLFCFYFFFYSSMLVKALGEIRRQESRHMTEFPTRVIIPFGLLL